MQVHRNHPRSYPRGHWSGVLLVLRGGGTGDLTGEGYLACTSPVSVTHTCLLLFSLQCFTKCISSGCLRRGRLLGFSFKSRYLDLDSLTT